MVKGAEVSDLGGNGDTGAPTLKTDYRSAAGTNLFYRRGAEGTEIFLVHWFTSSLMNECTNKLTLSLCFLRLGG